MKTNSSLSAALISLAVLTIPGALMAQADFPYKSRMVRHNVTLDPAGSGSWRQQTWTVSSASGASVTMLGVSALGGGGVIARTSQLPAYVSGQPMNPDAVFDYDPRNVGTTWMTANLAKGDSVFAAYDNGSSTASNAAKIAFVEDQWHVTGKNAAGSAVVWEQLPNSVVVRQLVEQFSPIAVPVRLSAANRYVMRYAIHSADSTRTVNLIRTADFPKWQAGTAVSPVWSWGVGVAEQVLPMAPAASSGVPAGDYWLVALPAAKQMRVVMQLQEFAPAAAAWTARPNDFPYVPRHWISSGSLTSGGRGEAVTMPSAPVSSGTRTRVMSVSRSWNQTAIFDPSQQTAWEAKKPLDFASAGKVYTHFAALGSCYGTVHLLDAVVPKGKTFTAGLRNVRSTANPWSMGVFFDQPTVAFKSSGVTLKTWRKVSNPVAGCIENAVLSTHSRFFRVHPQSRCAIRFVGSGESGAANTVHIISEEDIVRYRAGQPVTPVFTLNSRGTEQVLPESLVPAGNYYLVAPHSGQRGVYEICEYR